MAPGALGKINMLVLLGISKLGIINLHLKLEPNVYYCSDGVCFKNGGRPECDLHCAAEHCMDRNKQGWGQNINHHDGFDSFSYSNASNDVEFLGPYRATTPKENAVQG